jgi:hypothetical protein
MPKKMLIGNSALLAVAALCVPIFLSACLFVAYPSVTYAPGVNVGEQPEEVHCFRLDSKKDPSWNRDKNYEIREIPVSAKGGVKGQIDISVETGWVGLVNQFTSHSTCLLLYRPGYELEEITSWEFRNKVKWKKCMNASAKEGAIDKLITFNRIEAENEALKHWDKEDDRSSNLDRCHTSKGYEAVIALAVSEYERLGQSDLGKDQDSDAIRARLADKVRKLKELVAKDADRNRESLSDSLAEDPD